MATISKANLAHTLSDELEVSMTLAKQLVATFFEALTETIADGNRIEARGFGVFIVKRMKAKQGRNPRTGEQVYVPARRKVKFKPGKLLKEALSRPLEHSA
jgi:nucleoid DNA-binding protein